MASDPESRRHPGPPLILLSIACTALFFASLVSTTLMTRGGYFPSPFDPTGPAARFFVDEAEAVRVAAFLQLGSAIVLGLFAATTVSRLRFFGVEAAGAWIALFGGLGAAILGVVSALLTWVVAELDLTIPVTVVHPFHLLLFALGGVGQVALSGLLVAGVSISGALFGLMPRWVMWFGLVLFIVAELSTLTILLPAAVYLVPLSRVGLFAWMITVSVLLPVSRPMVLEEPAASPVLREAHNT